MRTLDLVKEFWTYTLLRVALFLGTAAIVYGVWSAFSDQVPVLWVIVIGFVVSGVGSYYLLARYRAAFAKRVEDRARRASERLEEIRSKEDSD